MIQHYYAWRGAAHYSAGPPGRPTNNPGASCIICRRLYRSQKRKRCRGDKISLIWFLRRTVKRLRSRPGPRRARAWPLALLLVAFCVVLASLPVTAGAYNVEKQSQPPTGSLSISPAKVEANVKAGDSASRDITLTNGTGGGQTLTFSIQDFEGSPDPSKAFVLKGDQDGKFSARHWLTPELTSINLNPGEQLTFRVNISVPSEAEPGGHYAALIVSPAGQSPGQQQATSTAGSSVLTLFLITVEGNVIQQGNLEQPQVPALSAGGPIDIGLVFANQGNVHLKPHGTVTVSNMLGQDVARIDAPEWVVLPDSSRRETVSWDSGLLFGRYSVKAVVQYGDGSTAVMTASFWAFSWYLLLALLAAIVIIILLVVRVVRRRRRRLEAGAAVASRAGPPGKDVATASSIPGEQPGARAGAAATASPAKEQMPQGNLPEAGQADASAEAQEAGTSVAARAGEPGQSKADTHLPLREIFPSMEDKRIVDITDAETKKLIRTMIDDQIGLARAYIDGGDVAAARHELKEARSAAEKLGLFSEIGLIDDILRHALP